MTEVRRVGQIEKADKVRTTVERDVHITARNASVGPPGRETPLSHQPTIY